MRTTCLVASVRLAIAAIVTLSTVSSLAAQERPAGLLNTLAVRTMVARSDPVDNDRLVTHFKALWQGYLTDAERHESMARSLVGNPNRSAGGNITGHCEQLARRDRQSAKILRELALYHKQLAEGTPATLPRGAARFQGGAGAPEPNEQELDALASQARTRTDHLALEEYLRTRAKRYTRTATEHTMQALTYRGGRFAQAAVHHEHLASAAREAAREATRAAALQQQLAKLGR
jgi:hypothetical protein